MKFGSAAVTLVKIYLLICVLAVTDTRVSLGQVSPHQREAENFLRAIRAEDHGKTASEMLESNTNLARSTAFYGKQPLLEATVAGNLSLVKRMVELGTDINVHGDNWDAGNSQNTALHVAVQYNQPAVLQWLLEAGADPNQVAFGATTPLHLAFSQGQEAMADWLLDYGANPFREKQIGMGKTTAFDLAISQSSGKLIPRMLEQDRQNPLGAKTRVKPSKKKNQLSTSQAAAALLADRGTSLLQVAAQHGELEAVQALIKAGVKAGKLDPKEDSMLQAVTLSAAAAAKGRAANLAGLKQTRETIDSISRNRDPNANPAFLNSLRSTEAKQAAVVENSSSERRKQILALLIKAGAEYDAFAATALGDLEQTRRILNVNKSVPFIRNHDGETPLFWAVKTDLPAMTPFWIESGAPLDATNTAGLTALHLAATLGLTGQVKILLLAHAPLEVRDTNGWTPLDTAIHAKQTESIRLLMDKNGASAHPERAVATSLHEAAATGNLPLVSALLETTTNLEARNELGLTPFQLSVLKGHLASAALLVDKGANVNARDPAGNNLLHQIILQGDWPSVDDAPSSTWLAHFPANSRNEPYLKYLRIPRTEIGPNTILQVTSFLLLCGLDAKATNGAGKTATKLAANESAEHRLSFFDDGRAKFLKLLVAAGGDVNERDANGDTALHRAAHDFGGERVAALIAAGVDLNATNLQGQTPLHRYAEKIGGWDTSGESREPFQFLIKSKADVNARDNEGLTPLHVIALSDSTFKKEATRTLLDAGANPALQDHHGRTPVHLFLSGKWPWSEAAECIAMLVKAGADLSARDNQGKTPLHYLAALGYQSPLSFIRDITNQFTAAKADVQARDQTGDTPLHVAARNGTGDAFDWLVKQGAGIDETNNVGETPRLLAAHSTNVFARFNHNADLDIYSAISQGKMDAVTTLLAQDPTLINRTNQFTQTPLLVAINAHRTNMIEYLEKHGAHWDAISSVMGGRPDKLADILSANPSVVNMQQYGSSLLSIAASRGDLEITRTLLTHQANVATTNSGGFSPLGIALLEKHPEVADQLRVHGAKENIFDAASLDDLSTVKVLFARDPAVLQLTNGRRHTITQIAVSYDGVAVLKFFLDKGAHAGSTPPYALTLLHIAALHNATNCMALLLRRKTDVEAVNRFGFTPLHVAAAHGSTEAAAQLLKGKADPNARIGAINNFIMSQRYNPEGGTPLHLAALNGNTNTISLLLKSGANVNATDSAGRTPLDLTARPALPAESIWQETGMISLSDLYGEAMATSKKSPYAVLQERHKAAATLLENNGGKKLRSVQPMSGPPSRVLRTE